MEQEAILLNFEQSLTMSPPKGARDGALWRRIVINPPNQMDPRNVFLIEECV
jgi:hypothetical protein